LFFDGNENAAELAEDVVAEEYAKALARAHFALLEDVKSRQEN